MEQSKKYVGYIRLSIDPTRKVIGKNMERPEALGLDAQRQTLAQCTAGGTLLNTYVEIKSGKGRAGENRPILEEAIAHAKSAGAILIVAKLDRLARDVEFIFALQNSGVKIQACDLPEFNTLTLAIFAAFAQYERERISERTAAALKVKWERAGEWRVGGITNEARELGIEKIKDKAKSNQNNRRAIELIKAKISGPIAAEDLRAIAERANKIGADKMTIREAYSAIYESQLISRMSPEQKAEYARLKTRVEMDLMFARLQAKYNKDFVAAKKGRPSPRPFKFTLQELADNLNGANFRTATNKKFSPTTALHLLKKAEGELLEQWSQSSK
jgi:DNA invertase Pin-like site-specific DNA recombinase